jgi:hypothetical protein
MACKRSAVRSRLAPPEFCVEIACFSGMSPSSRGLGHHPFTVRTGVRIPVGTPLLNAGYGVVDSVSDAPKKQLTESSGSAS